MIVARMDIVYKKEVVDIRVKCSLYEYVGAWVYLDVSGEVRVARSDDINTARVFGRVIEKSTDTDCTVRRFGEVEMDTELLNPKKYYLSAVTNGGMTIDKSPIQVEIGFAITPTRFFIDVYNKLIIRA